MGAKVQHRTILVENILGTVAVMNIPIDDQNSFGAMLRLRVPGRNGDIVKQAKAHPQVGRSMMAGRPNGAESICDLAAKNRVNGGDTRTRG
jgi:hypothetical protein